jgi:hypothetical protein
MRENFLANQRREQRIHKRRAGIAYHRKMLRRELGCIEIKEEYEPSNLGEAPKVVIDQSMLRASMNHKTLKAIKQRIAVAIEQSYTDAKAKILNLIESKRAEERERKEKLRQDRLAANPKPKFVQQQSYRIIDHAYSDCSHDTAVEPQEEIFFDEPEPVPVPVPHVPYIPPPPVPMEYELDEPDYVSTAQQSCAESDAEIAQNVIFRGRGWLAIVL